MKQESQLQRGWPARGTGVRCIMIDDGCTFIYSETPPSVADIHRWIDNYGRGGVDVLGWDMMFGEVAFFDSAVGEPPAADNWCGALIASGHDPEKAMRPQTNFRHMKQAGIDLPAVVAARAREHGIRFFPAVRMVFAKCSSRLSRSLQDDASAFISHDPGVIAAGRWDARFNLNYAHPKVYKHRLAIIREIIERYEIDGMYLSFRALKPPQLAAADGWGLCKPFEKTVEVMNRFIHDVRRLLNAKAAACGIERLALAVGVPQTLQLCLQVGLDVSTWIAEEWVDAVAPKHVDGLDPAIPVEQFTCLPGADKSAFYPGFSPVCFYYLPLALNGRPEAARVYGTDLVRIDVRDAGDDGDWYPAMEHYRSALHNFYSAGASGYLGMNFMYAMSRTGDWWFPELSDPQRVAAEPHHYLYYADPDSMPLVPLEVPVAAEPRTHRLRIGDDLSQRGSAHVLIGVANLVDPARFTASVNAQPLALSSTALDSNYFNSGSDEFGNGHLFIAELPRQATKTGDNELSVRLAAGAGTDRNATLRWIEVVVW